MEKRELPTRHNFLTEAVKNLLEPKVTSTEPLIDANSVITVTTDLGLLKEYELHDIPIPTPCPVIEQVPKVTRIKPIPKLTKKQLQEEEQQEIDANLSDDYYLKRHRRHEKEEKTQKNREKERLRHGYYQQKQLVERIKTMEKSLLQSIVSSIRHRTHYEGGKEEEEEYLNDLHCRLLNDAVEHLKRYELLGLSNEKQQEIIEEHKAIENNNTSSHTSIPTTTAITTTTTTNNNNNNNNNNNIKFKEALQSEAIKQRSRQIKSFSKQPMFAGDSLQNNRRRSNRHVIAFGQKLPDFNEINEFSLPIDILNWKENNKK